MAAQKEVASSLSLMVERSAAVVTVVRAESMQGEISSRDLLQGNDRVAIRHGECIYWLRATRQGRLLLTK